jgi:murein DD-endopeptidase MepM/ murein hydrolase activator NlpD
LALTFVLAVAAFVLLVRDAGHSVEVHAAPDKKFNPPPQTGTRARVQEPAPVVPAPPKVAANPDAPPSARKDAAEALQSLPAPPSTDGDPTPLLNGAIALPLPQLAAKDIYDTFNEARGGGERRHEATDIMAPKGTPVFAVVDGLVKKLFDSKAGGLTIYQFDSQEKYCYYYAHLDRYADGLREGQLVKRGTTIGYVGTTGNAAPNAPHLHFAIFELGPDKRWWEGKPVNPYSILMNALQRQQSKR